MPRDLAHARAVEALRQEDVACATHDLAALGAFGLFGGVDGCDGRHLNLHYFDRMHLARLHERLTFASKSALKILDALAQKLQSHGSDAKAMTLKQLMQKGWSWPSPMCSSC